MKKLKILLFLFAFLVSLHGFSQKNIIEESIAEQNYSNDWQLYKTIDQVEIYFQYTTCENDMDCCEFVFLKFQNTSDLQLKVMGNLKFGRFISQEGTTRYDARNIDIDLLPDSFEENGCNALNNDIPFLIIREKANIGENYISEIELNNIQIQPTSN